ncbi:ZYRO0F11242p [Zygosaccharomyces rouxii]|uniref:ZYRO0F11242p n=1 Tax=Zygosaccharomyces rouxii (strain ATCC 2623 / CBS 732 / NBRC 1130 / NCYC 568 / NRRL Y-229) TaxID=559307 RepID=C5DY93_ZYGRC|nr:uncharacterized protein ZYRO0F11242g [Zygosaccharomyces rouxii]CAR28754.1 ZYRO0F11242p [Zygosaccharomyces rouxii]
MYRNYKPFINTATAKVSTYSNIMGGSQLKNLKATLKANDLTGQTAPKKKKGSKRQAKNYDHEERQQVIAKIREQFSPFEIKAAKSKQGKEKMVPVGKPGTSKQIGEEQRQRIFEAKKAQKNKQGGVVDRRFGERSRHMTEEEKMLERFTREKQSQSKSRKNLFDLNDDDGDDMFGAKLTHLGQDLEDDFDEGDLGVDEEDDKGGFSSKRKYEDSLGEPQPESRKKTKAEVMQEVIAKSKFYKQQRQKSQEQRQDQIEELDEGFDDIMSELRSSNVQRNPEEPNQEEKDKQKEYDMKVRELIMDRRAAPADRTKTEEEIKKEEEEKMKRLEQQRIDRMSGIVMDEDGEEKGVDDLDDDFWGSDEEQEGSGEEAIADSDEDVQLSSEDEGEARRPIRDISCPDNHKEFMDMVKGPVSEHPKIVKKIIKAYQPKLAEGNKEKLGKFTGIILRHMIFLSEQKYSGNVPEFASVQNSLLGILKSMSEKYNHPLSDTCRDIIKEMQIRFKEKHFSGLSVGDLTFFTLVGCLFSTSDQYHLIVTPCSILIAEFLEQIKFNSLERLGFGAVLVRISLQYQRLAKRYIPEVTYFLEKSLATFLANDNCINFNVDTKDLAISKTQDFSKEIPSTLNLHLLFESHELGDDLKASIFLNILDSLRIAVTTIWKNLSAFEEICVNTEFLLNEIIKSFPGLKIAHQLLETIQKLKKFDQHYPLSLQNHRPLAIPSHAPKFEENFNPEKKSYDPSRTRNEINKMKAQLKKERKFTMKEIRKDTRFEARQKVDEDKKNAASYHAKMAQIFNTISTEEGAEKNKYEKEKKLRTGKH